MKEQGLRGWRKEGSWTAPCFSQRLSAKLLTPAAALEQATAANEDNITGRIFSPHNGEGKQKYGQAEILGAAEKLTCEHRHDHVWGEFFLCRQNKARQTARAEASCGAGGNVRENPSSPSKRVQKSNYFLSSELEAFRWAVFWKLLDFFFRE